MMRRLVRIIIRSLTVLSLLLCVGTYVLWARSFYASDEMAFVGKGKLSIVSAIGWLEVHRCECFYSGPFEDLTQSYGHAGPYSRSHRLLLNFGRPDDLFYDHETCEGCDNASGITNESRDTLVCVPIWLIATLLTVLPATRLLRALHERVRPRPGCCSRCNYDLRATPDRCPECGAVPYASRP